MFIVGWGTIEFGGPVSDILQEVKVNVWDSKVSTLFVKGRGDFNSIKDDQCQREVLKGHYNHVLCALKFNETFKKAQLISW